MIVTCCHIADWRRHARTIRGLEPLGITGRIYRKSPPNTTLTPPKGEFESQMSYNDRSTASAQCRCYIGTSSQIIKGASRNTSAYSEFLLIERMDIHQIQKKF